MKERKKFNFNAISDMLGFIGAIALAIVLMLIFLALDSHAPGDVLSSAYWSTFSTSFRTANTVARMLIILLAGLAAAIPFSAGIWNIGGDGQIVVGGFAAALVGISFINLPMVIHLPMALLAGMIAGALWAAIPAFLRLQYKANEIVTTIMMNYLAVLLTDYLVNYPFRAPGSSSPETIRLPETAILPTLVKLSNLSAGLFVTILAFIIIYVIIRYTVLGYEWRILGLNVNFAKYGGVKDKAMRFLSMLIGGALAGLAGAILVMGVQRRFVSNISAGVGFNGVLIAIIAGNSPILVLVISSIFAILQSSVVGMESKIGVAVELSDIIQSTIILFVILRQRIFGGISKIFKHRSRKDGLIG